MQAFGVLPPKVEEDGEEEGEVSAISAANEVVANSLKWAS